MKLQSGESVTIDILGSAEKLVWDIIAQVLWLLAFVAFVAAAPFLYFFFGHFCARSGDTTFPMIYVFTSPLPAAVWTLFICRWRKIRQWQRAGKDLGVMGSNWREAEGGWTVSILKSFGIMFLAGFSSFAAQMLTVFWVRASDGAGSVFHAAVHGRPNADRSDHLLVADATCGVLACNRGSGERLDLAARSQREPISRSLNLFFNEED